MLMHIVDHFIHLLVPVYLHITNYNKKYRVETGKNLLILKENKLKISFEFEDNIICTRLILALAIHRSNTVQPMVQARIFHFRVSKWYHPRMQKLSPLESLALELLLLLPRAHPLLLPNDPDP